MNLVVNLRQRFRHLRFARLAIKQVIAAGLLDDLAHLSRLEAEGDLGQAFIERAAIDPAPIPARFLGRSVFRIEARQIFKSCATHDLLANFVDGLAPAIALLAFDVEHDHPELELLLARVLLDVLMVIIPRSSARERPDSPSPFADRIACTMILSISFCLNWSSVSPPAARVRMKAERSPPNSSRTMVSTRSSTTWSGIFAFDFLLHLFKLLQNQLAIDEIIHRLKADLLDLFVQRFAFELLMGRLLLFGDEHPHLRKGHDIVVHLGRDAIEHILAPRKPRRAKQKR